MKTILISITIIFLFSFTMGRAHFAKNWENKAAKYEEENNCYNKAKQYAHVWSSAGYDVAIVYGYDKSFDDKLVEAWPFYKDGWVALTEYDMSQIVFYRGDNGSSFALWPFTLKDGTNRIGPTHSLITTVTHVENRFDM